MRLHAKKWLLIRRFPGCIPTLCLAVLIVTTLHTVPVGAATSVEYEVKAAFLYNFAKFVRWPAVDRPIREITICVLGKDPFDGALDALTGKTVQGVPMHVRRITEADQDGGCQIVFVSGSEVNRIPEVLKRLKSRQGILSVSDISGFVAQGGVIELLRENSHIRFAVNMVAAKDAGLTVSSKLLRLATRVEGSPQP